MSALIPLQFDTHEIRIQVDEFGNPWWVAKDICDVLGLSNPTEQLRKLRPTEKALRRIEGIPQAPHGVNVINEPGLYRLLMRSDKPEAERFQDWVVQEVLPSIRQTGSYAPTLPAKSSGDLLVQMAEAYRDQEKRLQLTEAKAHQANENALRALESQLFFTVAEYICFNNLTRQVPKSAYKECSDHLRLYCHDNGIPFRKIGVGGQRWNDEYGFHISVYSEAFPGWLMRRYGQQSLKIVEGGKDA